MEQHIRIIGLIDIIFGVLGILAGVLIIVAFPVIGGIIGASDPEAGAVGGFMAAFGVVLGLVTLAAGILYIIVGTRLKRHVSWARVAQIILAVLGILSFPIGTAFGAYSLWALLNDDGKALFTNASPGSAS